MCEQMKSRHFLNPPCKIEDIHLSNVSLSLKNMNFPFD